MHAGALLHEHPIPSGGAELLSMALEESVRRGRESGELLPIPQESTMPPPGDQPVEVRLAAESISAVEAAAKRGTKAAIEEALNEDHARQVFTVFFTVLREQMVTSTGNWFWGGIGSALKSSFWFILGIFVLLVIGGPALLKGLWTTLLAGLTKG